MTLREQSWDDALFWLESEPIFSQAEIVEVFKQKYLSEFSFKYENLNFRLEGPFFRSAAEFRQEVRQTLKASGGATVGGARKALEYETRSYLDAIAIAKKELKLESPPVRWAEDHFKWLINYQIDCMTYREIGRAVYKHEKTVREGTKDVAKLMNLKLRSSDADKYRGRPKGAKDKTPRIRVDRRREKVRGNGN